MNSKRKKRRLPSLPHLLELGKFVARSLEDAQINPFNFSKRCGVGAATISEVINAQRLPRVETLGKIAKGLTEVTGKPITIDTLYGLVSSAPITPAPLPANFGEMMQQVSARYGAHALYEQAEAAFPGEQRRKLFEAICKGKALPVGDAEIAALSLALRVVTQDETLTPDAIRQKIGVASDRAFEAHPNFDVQAVVEVDTSSPPVG